MTQDAQNVACHKHSERIAVAVCSDCGDRLCERCEVEVPGVGTFCWDCAARRGGLRAGHRKGGPAVPEEERILPLGAEFGPTVAVSRFEARVADREPHHLISGLTERLAEAGADREDVVDDAEINEDVARLQTMAAAVPARRWGRH
ncbi:MAG TPA: hypothetical protein VFV32_05970 [Acidimicrobiales bacterium]|jgi:hypothetical protein|nr:hypothetical protein [Acidimicrobiales bacterium]